MATATQIADLRRKIQEPTTAIYTDETLSDWIDAKSGDLAAVAQEIWVEKAGRFMGMDFEADGGKFYASQLHDQAMKMAELYGKQIKMIIKRNPPETRYDPTTINRADSYV